MIIKNIFNKTRSTNFIIAQFYHDNVIDHYENPRNVGSMDKSKKNVGTGLVGAPACGDVMKLQI
jgi:NifU-like protein involved in Fe-S cluster formation